MSKYTGCLKRVKKRIRVHPQITMMFLTPTFIVLRNVEENGPTKVKNELTGPGKVKIKSK